LNAASSYGYGLGKYNHIQANNYISPLTILSQCNWYYSSGGIRTFKDGVTYFAVFGLRNYNPYNKNTPNHHCIYIPCIYMELPIKLLKVNESNQCN